MGPRLVNQFDSRRRIGGNVRTHRDQADRGVRRRASSELIADNPRIVKAVDGRTDHRELINRRAMDAVPEPTVQMDKMAVAAKPITAAEGQTNPNLRGGPRFRAAGRIRTGRAQQGAVQAVH